MSYVTNYIVQASSEYGGETWRRDSEVLFQKINDALAEDGHPPAPDFAVFKDGLGRYAYGGSKVLECDIRLWALNHCRPQTFLPLVQAAVDELDWKGYGGVQVLYLDQEDEVFSEWRAGQRMPWD